MVVLIGWADLPVGHCFEVALTVISNAPKCCVSDFLRHVTSFEKGIDLGSSYNSIRYFHSDSASLLSSFLQQLRIGRDAIVVNLVFTSLQFKKKCCFSTE